MVKRIIFAAVALLAIASVASAATVRLEWDANTEPDLAGYRLSPSGANGGPYLPLQSFGIVTTATVPAGDGPHYYVLSALDTSGNESAYSNQVYLQVDETAPAAPVLRGAVVRP